MEAFSIIKRPFEIYQKVYCGEDRLKQVSLNQPNIFNLVYEGMLLLQSLKAFNLILVLDDGIE